MQTAAPAAKGGNPVSFGALIFRLMCTRSDRKRDAGQTVPANVKRHDNLVYGSDPRHHTLDLYLPADAGGSLPVIVSFHGGGWVYGTKETYQFYCMSLAARGFAVINYNYRLAPKHRFPAPFEDTNQVFHWLMQHAAAYHLDTERIFGAGDSAGALGIGLYACILTNPDYARRFRFRAPEGLHLRGLALNCGMYTTADKAQALADFLPKQNADDALQTLDLVQHITPDFPPCFVMTANKDFLQAEPNVLLPVLEQNGVAHTCHIYGDDTQPLGHVFHCDLRLAQAKEANDAECAFFAQL